MIGFKGTRRSSSYVSEQVSSTLEEDEVVSLPERDEAVSVVPQLPSKSPSKGKINNCFFIAFASLVFLATPLSDGEAISFDMGQLLWSDIDRSINFLNMDNGPDESVQFG